MSPEEIDAEKGDIIGNILIKYYCCTVIKNPVISV